MKNGLILLGGGGHCISVLDTLGHTDQYDKIVILDPNIRKGTEILGHEVVGGDEMLPELVRCGFKSAFITVASIRSTSIRRKLYDMASSYDLVFPNIIDDSAYVSPSAKIGRGIFVGKRAVINGMAEIGDMAIINTASLIEHECEIGDFVHIAVGAVICGATRIGNDSFIGANATVVQGIKLGEKTFIKAGETVVK